jgi:osmoprotectant transport system permease protein
MASWLGFMIDNRELVLRLAVEHVGLMLTAVGIATVIGLAGGILAARFSRLGEVLLMVANTAQAVPSFAVMGLAIPFLGIGFYPAVFALLLRAVLPIYLNTHLGLMAVDRAVVDAARGQGMRDMEILRMVEIPLAAPVILAGIKTAAVESVAIATLAAFIGAGGLGDLILQGIAMIDTDRLLAGAVPAALMAVSIELGFRLWERQVELPAA